MALADLVTGLVLVLEDVDLLALAVLDDLSLNIDLGQCVCAGGDVCAINEKDRGECNLVACFTLQLLDLDEVAFGNLVLLAAGLDDRVHRGLPLISTRASAGMLRWTHGTSFQCFRT